VALRPLPALRQRRVVPRVKLVRVVPVAVRPGRPRLPTPP